MKNKKLHIGEIAFSVITDEDVLQAFHTSIHSKSKVRINYSHFFQTILTRNNAELQNLINNCDIVLSDGYGIYKASRFLYGENGFDKIYNGTDLYTLVLDEAERQSWRIFFLGDTETTIYMLQKNIPVKYPHLRIAGTHHGFFDFTDSSIVDSVNKSEADILMVGMGFPRQDLWISENYAKLNVPVTISVGAGIGFIAGSRKRAPQFLRMVHLEWLYRLLQEPKRLWRRYIIGIPQFCYYIALQKFRKKS